jgi:hypothetical protein
MRDVIIYGPKDKESPLELSLKEEEVSDAAGRIVTSTTVYASVGSMGKPIAIMRFRCSARDRVYAQLLPISHAALASVLDIHGVAGSIKCYPAEV